MIISDGSNILDELLNTNEYISEDIFYQCHGVIKINNILHKLGLIIVNDLFGMVNIDNNPYKVILDAKDEWITIKNYNKLYVNKCKKKKNWDNILDYYILIIIDKVVSIFPMRASISVLKFMIFILEEVNYNFNTEGLRNKYNKIAIEMINKN